MSTTPSIFRKSRAAYTVIGGRRPDRIRGRDRLLSVLLLNRGNRFYSRELLLQLKDAGVGELISVESPKLSYDIEPLSRRHPEIRFVMLQEEVSTGEMINLAVGEARSRVILVMWSDMELSAREGLVLAAARVEQQGLLCAVPGLTDPAGEQMPSMQVPTLIRGRLQVVPFPPRSGGMRSLFPYDYAGMYHRGKFQLTGGFDAWMHNPFWQKLDFGLRSFLWGETIAWEASLRLAYTAGPPAEDSTPDRSYKLFFLKNVAVRFNGEMGVLPHSRLATYLLRSGSGVLEAAREFREVRGWVEENRFRFKSDLPSLVSHWEIPE